MESLFEPRIYWPRLGIEVTAFRAGIGVIHVSVELAATSVADA